jgi:Flp pilus assembly protein TadG
MRSRTKRLSSDERGAVAVVVALCLIVLMAAVALAVDVGGLMLRRRELVNGSDSAALSAARTCARGGADSRFATIEGAADYEALANSLIKPEEVAGTNIVPGLTTVCGEISGHVTVQYTSQQGLYFAPVLGFNHESPVTTTATASWGLGSNNAIPLVMSGQLQSTCPQPPPTGVNTVGQPPCGTWYDNDALNNGNFGFLTLNPEGWDVSIGDNCSAAQSGGSNQLADWISGHDPTSIALNWTDPTYVCVESGLKGNSNPWGELQRLADQHAVRDFPITWEGCGNPAVPCPPPGSAVSQGAVYQSGKIDKYDVIGFAALMILDVVTPQEAGNGTTTQEPFTDFTYTNNDITFPSGLPSGAVVSYTWTGHRTTGQQQPSNGTCAFTTNQALAAGTYPWGAFGNGNECPGNTNVLDAGQPNPITITVPVTTYGPCGPPPPSNNSTRCVVTQWQGSTLTGDYQSDPDNLRVVRLCNLDEGTCLDQ